MTISVRSPRVGPTKVMAILPSYDGSRHNGSAIGALQRAGVDTYEESRSLLANVFNSGWVEALNRRPEVTHVLMLHADVVPIQPDWFQRLMDESVVHGCRVLSVALPIKSPVGLTSTALDGPDKWRPRRLTTTEILERPYTWTAENLLVNTGLMLVNFRDPWVERVCFTINDRITKMEDGRWVADVEPEDWNFSRQCRALGVPVHVTRAVRAFHVGMSSWRNDEAWGEATDPMWKGEP